MALTHNEELLLVYISTCLQIEDLQRHFLVLDCDDTTLSPEYIALLQEALMHGIANLEAQNAGLMYEICQNDEYKRELIKHTSFFTIVFNKKLDEYELFQGMPDNWPDLKDAIPLDEVTSISSAIERVTLLNHQRAKERASKKNNPKG